MSHKQVEVRMVPASGRFIVEVRIGTTWHTVAIRERRDTATRIRDGLFAVLRDPLADDDEANRHDRERLESIGSPGQ